MLEPLDFIILYLVVFLAMISSLSLMVNYIYRTGLPRLERLIQNDVPHSIQKGLTKVFNIQRSRLANEKKSQYQAQAQAEPDFITKMLSHPVAQMLIPYMMQSMQQPASQQNPQQVLPPGPVAPRAEPPIQELRK